ncbi:unnamed protein product [Caenorhabditis nigoni]
MVSSQIPLVENFVEYVSAMEIESLVLSVGSVEEKVFKKAHPPRRRNLYQRIRGAFRWARKRILRERDEVIYLL